MAETRLPPRVPSADTAYVDDGLIASRWDNEDLLDAGRGAIVMGTHDVEQARHLANQAICAWFGSDLAARRPERGWWLFGECSGVLAWLNDPEKGREGVLFTAEPKEQQS
ncbi:hypothetical protein [Amycolatopsis sp. DSM 110486]|uniref:hypothetical protein n=1 Tax=Amycolatopsis sp. DSM 110486 TaxID=2865832 RepID=UPI001C6A3889|nr:hypothetical protein [Amycolatopsis sp. DSM 110486]QYN17539.1 hypothetical protein K1T34_32660 [Amycolatopsis sp. DSM 110486]